METEMFERMDGLTAVGNQEGFAENAAGMIADLKAEGFDKRDIEEYLAKKIREAMNENDN